MRISHKRLTIWKTTFTVLLPIYGHKCWKKSSKIGRPDWTTSEPAVAVLCVPYASTLSITPKRSSSRDSVKSSGIQAVPPITWDVACNREKRSQGTDDPTILIYIMAIE
ncbi:zinc finger protein [Trichonephila clavipes]|nr:zinc finger protein [Trichonephila clavipes]